MKRRFSRSDSAILPRVVAELSAKAIQQNYHAIREQVPGQLILPMVKANAYGHGAVWASSQLLHLPALYGFGVATLEEGRQLREELSARARRVKILVCSGASHWNEEKGQFCERHNLTPVISTDEDWQLFFRQKWPDRIPYELKFNTGMNRLGMSPGLAKTIAKQLRDKSSTWHPSGVMTHLAMSESPQHAVSKAQKERFISIRSELSEALPSAHFHLANSGAIWNSKYWGLKELSDVVRPGLSLYGVPPWPGAPARGLAPVMALKAQVIAVRNLKPGETLGYGAAYKVPHVEKAGVKVAVLSAGYADGIHRMASGRGLAWLNGRATEFVGNVSMDLATLKATPGTRVGSFAELIGPHVDPWKQAEKAGTIPYELLTSVSARVEREYV